MANKPTNTPIFDSVVKSRGFNPLTNAGQNKLDKIVAKKVAAKNKNKNKPPMKGK